MMRNRVVVYFFVNIVQTTKIESSAEFESLCVNGEGLFVISYGEYIMKIRK